MHRDHLKGLILKKCMWKRVWACVRVCVCVDHLKRCKTSNLLDDVLQWFFQFDIAFLAFSFDFPTKAGGQGLQWLPCPTKLCHWRGSNWGRPVVYLQIVFNCWTRCPLRCYSFSGRILLHCFSRLVIHHLLSGLLECFFARTMHSTSVIR